MKTDVVVIGGGIAGAASAFFLSLQGLQVVVLDKTKFPRDKVCTSTVNPYTLTYLFQMGVMKELLADGMLPIEGMQGFSYDGNSFQGYYDLHYPLVNFGHTIPRYRLDGAMVNRILQIPEVTFLENCGVEEVLTNEAGRAIGVRAVHDGQSIEIQADLLIDAAGRGSIVARKYGLFQPVPNHERYAVICQFEGVQLPLPLFTVGTDDTIGPGYWCVFPITHQSAIVGLIVDPRVYAQVKPDPQAFVEQFIRRPDWVGRPWLAEAQGSEVVTFGPLAFTTKEITRNGILMVGDTTGFFDPLTGEGIGIALRSGQLAAETAAKLLRGGADWEGEHKWYAKTLLDEKDERMKQLVLMNRMLQRPVAYNRFVEALSSNQAAANIAARSFANMLSPEERGKRGLLDLVAV